MDLCRFCGQECSHLQNPKNTIWATEICSPFGNNNWRMFSDCFVCGTLVLSNKKWIQGTHLRRKALNRQYEPIMAYPRIVVSSSRSNFKQLCSSFHVCFQGTSWAMFMGRIQQKRQWHSIYIYTILCYLFIYSFVLYIYNILFYLSKL